METTAVIIVNYNKYDDTLACVESLRKMKNADGMEIIIVDNHSTNDSSAILRSGAKDCHVIQAMENNGYCAGNNIGIRYARDHFRPDYYWILNPDTMVDENALAALLEFAEGHRDAGLVGAKLIHYPDNKIQALGGGPVTFSKLGILRVPHAYNGESPDASLPAFIEVELVNGASMFIRKEVVEMIGLMDESLFMYMDENEYCVRAGRAGWKLYGAAKAIVRHKEGWREKGQKRWSEYYVIRNTLYLIQKYYPDVLAINLLHKVYLAARAVYPCLFSRDKSRFQLRARAVRDFLRGKRGKVDLTPCLGNRAGS